MPQVAVLALAVFLDLLIGDPRWLPHPVQIMGFFIKRGEILLRKIFPPLFSGAVLTVGIVAGTYFLTRYVVHLLKGFPYWGDVLVAVLLSTTIAIKGLTSEARKILSLLKGGLLDKARAELKALVGRDTKDLDEPGILRASVESLAENASDGIIAPIFYFAIGGLPLAMAYKAVNTLDSMIGYRSEKYILFGRAAARLDDIANFIPARLTGALISISALFTGLDSKRALRTMLKDGGKHPSPNSGVPMAAMAGALDTRLGGPAVYGGRLIEKKFIGEGKSPLSIPLAVKALRLTFASSILAVLVTGVILEAL
jgi:adenosylcobinamide-phosphate synthase